MPSTPSAPSVDSEPSAGHSRLASRWIAGSVAGAIVIAISFFLDAPLATLLHRHGIDEAIKSNPWLHVVAHLIKLAGLFWYTLFIAVLLLILHPAHWRAAAVEICLVLTAAINFPLKWITGRLRPFKAPPFNVAEPFHLNWFCGGVRGFFHPSPDLSFVSGHAAVAFSTATGLGILLWRDVPAARFAVVAAYMIAVLVMAERVMENAHWLSDTTCAAALGIGGVALMTKLVAKLMRRSANNILWIRN